MVALNASRNAPFAKLSFLLNNSSLKSFHVILCQSKYSRLSFSGTFLFINLSAFNNAAIYTECAKTDDSAATCLESVTFEIIISDTEKLPGVDETDLSGGALSVSKNLTRNTFLSFICSIRVQEMPLSKHRKSS